MPFHHIIGAVEPDRQAHTLPLTCCQLLNRVSLPLVHLLLPPARSDGLVVWHLPRERQIEDCSLSECLLSFFCISLFFLFFFDLPIFCSFFLPSFLPFIFFFFFLRSFLTPVFFIACVLFVLPFLFVYLFFSFTRSFFLSFLCFRFVTPPPPPSLPMSFCLSCSHSLFVCLFCLSVSHPLSLPLFLFSPLSFSCSFSLACIWDDRCRHGRLHRGPLPTDSDRKDRSRQERHREHHPRVRGLQVPDWHPVPNQALRRGHKCTPWSRNLGRLQFCLHISWRRWGGWVWWVGLVTVSDRQVWWLVNGWQVVRWSGWLVGPVGLWLGVELLQKST